MSHLKNPNPQTIMNIWNHSKKFIPAAMLALCATVAPAKINPADITIVSPYADVNWSTHGQYKASLHVHTTNSDGGQTLAEAIEEHYKKGYDILAITDHNVLTTTWTSTPNGPTEERAAEIAAGVGRNGRGMLEIPATNEQSHHDHLNTFFVNHPGRNAGPDLEGSLAAVEKLGGISHLNHPGRYTGGQKGGEEGEAASNDSKNIAKYVNLFKKYPSCVGMEIINKRDGESASDRILWDNILQVIIPQGRYVWGFSNDDSHGANGVDHSYNVFVMPANNTDNFKAAMKSGAFYAVARRARREQGPGFPGNRGAPPVINAITVDATAATITINASNTATIDWVSNGSVIASGATLDLTDHPGAGIYVRANVMGPGGVAFTQPFGITNPNTKK